MLLKNKRKNVEVLMPVNQTLDEVIRTRRSIRMFTAEMPAKEDIEAIIQAGVLAPFSGLANTGKYGRRFFCYLPIASIVKKRANVLAEQLKSQMNSNPLLQTQGQGRSLFYCFNNSIRQPG
jgi:nitroreductase